MNAITDPAVTDGKLQLLQITDIRPSGTAVQALRRKHYHADKLAELAASIVQNGVLQPILVRPVTFDEQAHYEIVAGERRYLAAERAGLREIPAVIRDLDAVQTLQAQLVENIEREQLSALEEAVGFDEMRKNSAAINADEIGARIGKSRSYVYARLKLLDLIPEARDALASGELDASKALVLARIKGEKMQARALKLITANAYHYSYRRLIEKLRDDFMIRLVNAPWLPGRDNLINPKTGYPVPACASCIHNSDCDAELAAEAGPSLCTDRGCFDVKTQWHWKRLRENAAAAGNPVLTGDQAAAVLDLRAGYMGQDVKGGHVRLDARCDTIEFPEPEPKQAKGEPDDVFEARHDAWDENAWQFEPPTYAELIGDLPEAKLVEGKGGEIIPVAPVEAVARALKAKGIKVPEELKPQRNREEPDEDPAHNEAERQAAEAARAREEQRRKIEQEYRNRLVKAIHAKYKGPLKLHELQVIADELTDSWHGDVMGEIYPDSIDVKKMKEPELLLLMVTHMLSREADSQENDKPSLALDLAQRLKIDAKKIKAEVAKDIKAGAQK